MALHVFNPLYVLRALCVFMYSWETKFQGAAAFSVSDPNAMSEDCLTINIIRPPMFPENASLPVMTWIYGGGYIIGASSLYDGSELVAHSTAIVSSILTFYFMR